MKSGSINSARYRKRTRICSSRSVPQIGISGSCLAPSFRQGCIGAKLPSTILVCSPSFRDGISPIERCVAIGKWVELSAFMDHHPATHDLKQCRIGDLSFDLNIEAIAQHYGFRTRLMYFSRSKDVAMFFATCQYDPVTESYAPMRKGTAVLYTADLKGLIDHRKGDATFLPLGLEPLPRPEAQRALAVRLNRDFPIELNFYWKPLENHHDFIEV